MVRIVGIVVVVILLGLAILCYFLIKRKKTNQILLKQPKKLTYWFLDLLPIIFIISALMVLLFVVIDI